MATSEKQEKQEEYFPVGSTVQCVTCLGETIEGIVVTFDRATKLLALKSYRPAQGSTKKSRVQQLQIINVNLVQEVNIVQETPPPASSQQVVVPNFNYTKISKRAVEEALRKRRSICADSVAPDGQKLFITIRKTIEDVQWKDGEHILVLTAVLVSPPYKSENVEICFNDADRHHHQQASTRAQAQRAADHVKKIIDQFWSKQSDETPLSSLGGNMINENNNDNNADNNNTGRRTSSSEPPESSESKRSSSPPT